jgi:PEP-CTERM motif-containing protein
MDVTFGLCNRRIAANSAPRTLLLGLLVLGALWVPQARADIVSLTAPTACPSVNGNGGNWCASPGVPFNLTSFTTQNITATGSSAFFVITNNTSSTVNSLDIIFTGTIAANQFITCGGGNTGIQGSGPGNGSTTCSVNGLVQYGPFGSGSTQVPLLNVDIHWGNLNWGAGKTFDLQIASFANGATGSFRSPTPVPEPSTLSLLAAGLCAMIGFVAFRKPSLAVR